MRASKLIACACALWLALCGPLSAVNADTPHAAARDAEIDDYAPAPVFTPDSATTNRAIDSTTTSGVAGPATVAETANGPVKSEHDAADKSAAVAAGSAATFAAQSAAPKKQNVFVRIITAPFRGLARLFGGGGNRRTARVRVEEIKRPETKEGLTAKQDAAAKQDDASATAVAPSPAQAGAATVLPHVASPAPSPQPSAADETEEIAPFVPLIVGVPRDPISQGRALLEQGYLNEAISELSVAAATGVQLVEANNLLGLAHDRGGRHAQAREYYERALTLAPGDAHVLNNLGHSLYLDDRYPEALSKLKEAARARPSDATINNNLALVYGRLRKYGDSLRHFRLAGGEFYARMRTGELLEAAGRDREAIRHFEAARRAAPDSSDALRRLITLYRRTGQRDKAEAAQRELDRPKTKSSDSTSG